MYVLAKSDLFNVYFTWFFVLVLLNRFGIFESYRLSDIEMESVLYKVFTGILGIFGAFATLYANLLV